MRHFIISGPLVVIRSQLTFQDLALANLHEKFKEGAHIWTVHVSGMVICHVVDAVVCNFLLEFLKFLFVSFQGRSDGGNLYFPSLVITWAVCISWSKIALCV